MSREDDVVTLIDAMRRFHHVRERFTAVRLSTEDGPVETAAFACLFVLDRGGPARSGAIAEALYTDPSTISRHVANLVQLGYVRREADPDDGRATILVVTELGHKRVNQLKAYRVQSIMATMGDWPDEDLATLANLFDRFVANAEAAAGELPAGRIENLEDYK